MAFLEFLFVLGAGGAFCCCSSLFITLLWTHPLIKSKLDPPPKKSKQASLQCVLLHEVTLGLPYFLGLTRSGRAMVIWGLLGLKIWSYFDV